jgi:hypothetical protein
MKSEMYVRKRTAGKVRTVPYAMTTLREVANRSWGHASRATTVIPIPTRARSMQKHGRAPDDRPPDTHDQLLAAGKAPGPSQQVVGDQHADHGKAVVLGQDA